MRLAVERTFLTSRGLIICGRSGRALSIVLLLSLAACAPAPQPAAQPAAPASQPAAAPNCDNPGEAVANANNACFDDRPVNTGSPLVPIGDSIPGNPTPSILLVQVGADGAVQRVMGKQISDNTQFHVAALTYAKTLTFRPAQKNGQPVKAWVEVMLRPIRKK